MVDLKPTAKKAKAGLMRSIAFLGVLVVGFLAFNKVDFVKDNKLYAGIGAIGVGFFLNMGDNPEWVKSGSYALMSVGVAATAQGVTELKDGDGNAVIKTEMADNIISATQLSGGSLGYSGAELDENTVSQYLIENGGGTQVPHLLSAPAGASPGGMNGVPIII